MVRKFFVGGNWKMNKTPADGVALTKELVAAAGKQADVEVVVCPPFTALDGVGKALEGSLLKLGAHVTLCGPSTLVPRVFEQMGCRVTHDVNDAIPGADVINLLRIQHERQRKTMFPSIGEYTALFGLNHARFARTKPDALIMHPGPINCGVEIASDLADCGRSVILEQVTNGLAIRMAVLYLINGGKGAAELSGL